jgi:3-hydroxyisobutyrate dehydrogenase-like beta-hydroxyacid dehydrogenase
MSLNLGLIGYGEVGQLFAREWVRRAAVTVYDRKFDDPALRAPLAKIASRDDVRLAESAAGAATGADFVISAVTADQAVAVAHAAAPYLKTGQIYVDLNSVSPSTKQQVAEAVRPGGADFVEFAVMSPVAGLGIASPILAGGARAAELAERLNPLGMKIEAVSSDIGVASATKLCRSIVIKGLEAIMVDLNLAAERAGVMAAVLKSLTASYPGMDWAEVARVMPTRVARHGVRRAAEMREAARMLEEMGLSGAFATAIADRHELYVEERRGA